MEIETDSRNATYPENINSTVSSALASDMSAYIIKMRESAEWKRGELKTEILLNSATRKVVLTVMHDMTEVESIHKDDSISIKIIEGRMKFHSPVNTVILDEGQLLTLRDKTRFTLTSLEESAFLLTIVTGAGRLEEN